MVPLLRSSAFSECGEASLLVFASKSLALVISSGVVAPIKSPSIWAADLGWTNGAGAQNGIRGASGTVVTLRNGRWDASESVGLQQELLRGEIVGYVCVTVQRECGRVELHAWVVHVQEVLLRLEGLVLTWFWYLKTLRVKSEPRIVRWLFKY